MKVWILSEDADYNNFDITNVFLNPIDAWKKKLTSDKEQDIQRLPIYVKNVIRRVN